MEDDVVLGMLRPIRRRRRVSGGGQDFFRRKHGLRLLVLPGAFPLGRHAEVVGAVVRRDEPSPRGEEERFDATAGDDLSRDDPRPVEDGEGDDALLAHAPRFHITKPRDEPATVEKLGYPLDPGELVTRLLRRHLRDDRRHVILGRHRGRREEIGAARRNPAEDVLHVHRATRDGAIGVTALDGIVERGRTWNRRGRDPQRALDHAAS